MSGHFLWAALISLTHKIESRKAETLWREECECLRGNKKNVIKKDTECVGLDGCSVIIGSKRNDDIDD